LRGAVRTDTKSCPLRSLSVFIGFRLYAIAFSSVSSHSSVPSPEQAKRVEWVHPWLTRLFRFRSLCQTHRRPSLANSLAVRRAPSVCICVHPWLNILSFSFQQRIQRDQEPRLR
jgi:hypothetical protein